MTNAPATWQALIDAVVDADLQPSVMVYLDDVIVSKDFKSHVSILKTVFDAALRNVSSVAHIEVCVDELHLHPDPTEKKYLLLLMLKRLDISLVSSLCSTILSHYCSFGKPDQKARY